MIRIGVGPELEMLASLIWGGQGRKIEGVEDSPQSLFLPRVAGTEAEERNWQTQNS